MRNDRRTADRHPRRAHPRVLIAGIGIRERSDAAAGLIAADRMLDNTLPEGVDVVDLGEGAADALEKLRAAQASYDRVIVLAAVRRGRVPGRIYAYRWNPGRQRTGPETLVERFLEAAAQQPQFPAEVVVIELEPADQGEAEGLSDRALRLLPEMERRARREAASPASRRAETPVA